VRHLPLIAALLGLAGCAVQPAEGDFLQSLSTVETSLTAACAVGEVSGPLIPVVSDHTGHTYIAEPDSDRVWVRNPFGLVPDQCYWVSTEPERPAWPEVGRPTCFEDGLAQDGTCLGDEARPDEGGWTFLHGGFIEVPGLQGRMAVHDSLAVAWSGEDHPVLRVVDLVPDASDCPESQHPWFFHRVLYSPVLTAGYTGFADGDLALDGEHLLALSPGNRQLAIWDLPLPCEDDDPLPEPLRVDLPCAPDGPLVIDPGHDRVFALCSSAATVVSVTGLDYTEPVVAGQSLLDAGVPVDLAHEPVSDTLWVASPDARGGRVFSMPADGGSVRAYKVPGASRLAVGQTEAGGVATGRTYAVGAGETGVYRFDPVTGDALVQHLDVPLRGIAAGHAQQEIVALLEQPDGSIGLRSYADADHHAAQANASVAVTLAAFLEFPRDPALDDETGLRGEIAMNVDSCADMEAATQGWDELDRTMYQVCCLQHARADHVAANLDYLEDAVLDAVDGEQDVEILLGINGTVLLQSAHCIHAGLELGHDELVEFGLPLLEVVGDRIDALAARGDLRPILLVHTSAGDADQVPYTCPELWYPDHDTGACDVTVNDHERYSAFVADLLDIASLTRVAEAYQGTDGCADGELPLPAGCTDLAGYAVEVQGLAGGFDRAVGLNSMFEDLSWPLAFAEHHPGDGPAFTYFGGGGNYPMVANAISKELAPWDMRLRASPFEVGEDPREWDDPAPAGEGAVTYLPGVTVSHTYLHEWARSGLFVMDAVWHGSTSEDVWATDTWPGAESTVTMGPADFAVLDHYLAYHVLSARDAEQQRVFYFHLPDIGGISLDRYDDGRVVCTDEAACDQRDALRDWIEQSLPALGPAIRWGLPEEVR